MKVELVTLGAVTLFIISEIYLVRPSVANSPVIYVFTILGLTVATAALYGPMLVSVASQIVVDSVMSPHDPRSSEPDYGPVEALERIGDYDGAVQECLVLVRIFPKDPGVALRIATNYASLDSNAEAAQWFERGLVRVLESDRAFRVTNRLADLYLRQLDQPDDAERVMTAFVDRFPDHERAGSMQDRIDRLAEEPVSGPVSPEVSSG